MRWDEGVSASDVSSALCRAQSQGSASVAAPWHRALRTRTAGIHSAYTGNCRVSYGLRSRRPWVSASRASSRGSAAAHLLKHSGRTIIWAPCLAASRTALAAVDKFAALSCGTHHARGLAAAPRRETPPAAHTAPTKTWQAARVNFRVAIARVAPYPSLREGCFVRGVNRNLCVCCAGVRLVRRQVATEYATGSDAHSSPPMDPDALIGATLLSCVTVTVFLVFNKYTFRALWLFFAPSADRDLRPHKQRMLAQLGGHVVEIGSGLGTNLQYLDPDRVRVERCGGCGARAQ